MQKFAIAFGTVAILVTATPALAQTGTTTTPASSINTACIQTAVDTREQAIDDAWGSFNTSITSALSARKSALHDAWGLTDAKARRIARATAWSTFNTASRTAHKTLETARKNAWSTFKTASHACGVPVVEAQAQDSVGNIGL